MNSIWSLPPSLRITLFVFMMISLSFLLFGTTFIIVSKRNKYLIAYIVSLFAILLLMATIRTPVIYYLNEKVCDYLSFINIVPIILATILFIKYKKIIFIVDIIWLIINITLFEFIPYYGYISSASLIYIVIRSVNIFFIAYKDSVSYPGKASIKYALDDLNEGVIFFNSFNQIIYINKTMNDILQSLDIKTYEKANVIYKNLVNKTTRKISDNDLIITTFDKSYHFIIDKKASQIICFDVTEEEKLIKQNELNKELLSELNIELNEQLSKIDELQKEKELIDIKGYIHDSLAQKLSILHMTLLMDKTTELGNLKEMLSELNVSNKSNRIDELEYLKELLSSIGVSLNIEGDLPLDDKIKKLFIRAIKECSTNAIRHGNAKNIDVIANNKYLLITNDGNITTEVNFGNGLSGIKIEAEQLGYSLIIKSEDKFIVALKKIK